MMSTVLFKFSVNLMKKLFTQNDSRCEHFSVRLYLTGGLVTKLLRIVTNSLLITKLLNLLLTAPLFTKLPGFVTNGTLIYKTPWICY